MSWIVLKPKQLPCLVSKEIAEMETWSSDFELMFDSALWESHICILIDEEEDNNEDWLQNCLHKLHLDRDKIN